MKKLYQAEESSPAIQCLFGLVAREFRLQLTIINYIISVLLDLWFTNLIGNCNINTIEQFPNNIASTQI